MSQVKSEEQSTAGAYATVSDFCRIFSEDISKLYLLAFLLTADPEKAEQCFASALEDCLNSSRVFREWARSWARRTVVQNAIRLAGVEFKVPGAESQLHSEPAVAALPEPLFAVSRLSTFERFVYVMSVLEHYTDQDCAVLLHCRRQQVVEGRPRALRDLARPAREASASRGFATPPLLAETA